MRTQNVTPSLYIGNTDGRRKWQWFGLLVGIVLTLAFTSNAGQIIRQQASQAFAESRFDSHFVDIYHFMLECRKEEEENADTLIQHGTRGLLNPLGSSKSHADISRPPTPTRLMDAVDCTRGYSYLLLMEIGLFGLIGALLSLHAYLHRFRQAPKKDWSSNQWLTVLAGVGLGCLLLCLSCSMTEDIAPRFAMFCIFGIAGGVRILLSKTQCMDTMFRYGFNAFLITLVIGIYLLMYTNGFYSFPLIPYSPGDSITGTWISLTMKYDIIPIIGLPLLVLPVACLYVMIVVNCVRYQPIASGVVRGFRTITLPMMTLLLGCYVFLTLFTAYQERVLTDTFPKSITYPRTMEEVNGGHGWYADRRSRVGKARTLNYVR